MGEELISLKSVSIKKAVARLKMGGVVAFPTETVYGLGARVFDTKAVKRIFKIKGRPANNPLIVHVGKKKDVSLIARIVSAQARKLIRNFWPGPLTLILPRARGVPKEVTAGLNTVAVRMPRHPVALALLRALGEPLAAPSANRSGRPSPTRAEHVRDDFGESVGFILDGGSTQTGLESTIVDVSGGRPRILRPGVISREEIEAKIGKIEFEHHQGKSRFPMSPGTHHKHYAPSCRVVLVSREQMNDGYLLKNSKGKNFGVLCRSAYKSSKMKPIYMKRVSGGLRRYAQVLFSSMREAEKNKIKVLFVETVPLRGIGVAIMDRLKRASVSL